LTGALAVTSKAVGLEVHAEKTQYMIISCDQNDRQNHNKKIGNKSSESMEQFRYADQH